MQILPLDMLTQVAFPLVSQSESWVLLYKCFERMHVQTEAINRNHQSSAQRRTLAWSIRQQSGTAVTPDGTSEGHSWQTQSRKINVRNQNMYMYRRADRGFGSNLVDAGGRAKNVIGVPLDGNVCLVRFARTWNRISYTREGVYIDASQLAKASQEAP